MSFDPSPPSKDKPVDPEADRSQWMNDAFDKDKEIPAYREKMLQLSSGFSFANAIFADTIQDISVANRYEILNLISQHLKSLGLNYTADMLSNESGFEFLNPMSKDWETTNLRMITSLSLGLRDSPWDEATELNHQFVLEEHEEDYNASPYREDPSLIWEEYFDPDVNSIYKSATKNFSTLTASTLRRVVVLITSNTKGYLSDEDLYNFFLSLHSVTSSEHFYEQLMYLFYLKGDNAQKDKLTPKDIELLRMNIINLLKKWLFFHGLFIGKKTLKAIEDFLKEITVDSNNFSYLTKFTKSILNQMPLLTYGQKQGKSEIKGAVPVIPDPAIILSLTLKLFDPDPIEIARQVTLLAHDVFCSIHSLEFINAFSKQNSSAFSTPTLNEFNLFNERITMLVLDTIAFSEDPSVTFLKAVEVCNHLLEIRNFGTLSAFVTALGRADTQELAKVSDETKKKVNAMYSSSENYEDSLLRSYSSWECAIPNMRYEIKHQLTLAKNDDMPQFINGYINWVRIRKLSERSSIMYRFQNIRYIFYPITQIQKVITRGQLHEEREIELKIDSRIKERNENRSR